MTLRRVLVSPVAALAVLVCAPVAHADWSPSGGGYWNAPDETVVTPGARDWAPATAEAPAATTDDQPTGGDVYDSEKDQPDGWTWGQGQVDDGATDALRRLQPSGRLKPAAGTPKVVRAVIAAANRIATTPYLWGGGHASWTAKGYDCSGSVSYALHGGELLDSPLVAESFKRYGTKGEGRWITVYASRDHTFMVVDGVRYDTSGRTGHETRWQAMNRSTSGYTVRHPVGL